MATPDNHSNSSHAPYLGVSRFLFAIMVALIVLLYFSNKQFTIDTNLSALNPDNQYELTIAEAIDSVSANIQRRILILISGDDEDQVFDAEQALRNQLSTLKNITVVTDNDTLASDFIELLKPYRFLLLNEQQKLDLKNKSDIDIVNQAKSSLYLSSSIRPYRFADDPLGWHSDYVLNALPSNQTPTSDSQVFHALVSLQIKQGAMDMNRQQTLSTALTAMTTTLETNYAVSTNQSGVFFFAADAAQKSKQDISFISTGSIIGVVLLLLIAFRSLWSLILPIVSILLGVGFAFLVSHSLHGKIHVLTIVFGASLIGIVIDYSLHYFYHRAADQNSNRTALHRALFLSLMTSLIGYSALSFSGLQALQHVAVFSCCGLLAAWLSVVCIGDVMTRQSIALDQRLIPSLQTTLSIAINAVKPATWWFLIGAILISAALLVSFSQVFSDDPRLFYKPSAELLNSEKQVAKVSNDYEPGRYLVVHGNTKQQVYQRTEQLFNTLETEFNVDTDHLLTIVQWVPSEQEQLNNYQLQQRLYGSGGIVTQLAEQLNLSADVVNKLQQEYQQSQQREIEPSLITEHLGDSMPTLWHGADNPTGITSFILIRKGHDTDALASGAQTIEGVSYVNALASTTNALSQQRYAASLLLIVAYVLVAALILIRYRSLKQVSMLLVPLVSSAMILLVCVGFGQTLNLFHVMALFLVLGFGMDYTIFSQELNDEINITQQAILLSAITSLLSFGLLALSSVPVAHSFGLSLLIGNSVNLLGVFVYSRLVNQHPTS